MLSGMHPKVQARYQKEIDEWLAKGNKITQVPATSGPRHTSRTKSHMKGGGRWGAYNVGGNHRVGAKRKSA